MGSAIKDLENISGQRLNTGQAPQAPQMNPSHVSTGHDREPPVTSGTPTRDYHTDKPSSGIITFFISILRERSKRKEQERGEAALQRIKERGEVERLAKLEESKTEAERLKRVQESKKRELEKQKREADHKEGLRLLSEINYEKIIRNSDDKIEWSPIPNLHNYDRIISSLNMPTDQKYRHEIAQLALKNAIGNQDKKFGYCYHYVKEILKEQKIIDINSVINEARWIKDKDDYMVNAYRIAEILEKLPNKFIETEIPPDYQGSSIKKLDALTQSIERKNAKDWFINHLPEGAIIVYGKSDEKFNGKDAKVYGHVAIVAKHPEFGKGEAYDHFTGFQDPRKYGQIRVFLPTKLPQ